MLFRFNDKNRQQSSEKMYKQRDIVILQNVRVYFFNTNINIEKGE